MKSLEQGNDPLSIDSQHERASNSFFQVRLGLGPHSMIRGNWHNEIGQDMESFFKPSKTSYRNIFFMEHAGGTEPFLKAIKSGYKTYSNYSSAWEYACMHFKPSEGFPSAKKVHELYMHSLAMSDSISPDTSDSARFYGKAFMALDSIIEKEGVAIEIALETRRNPVEQKQMEETFALMQSYNRFNSSEQLRQFALRIWNSSRLREEKYVEDLHRLNKEAVKKQQPTKVYVSLGIDHKEVGTMLETKLRYDTSHTITQIERQLLPEHVNRFTVVVKKGIELLRSKAPYVHDQWEELYKELSSS